MKVSVTQKHIDKGEPCQAGYCAVALALNEQTGLAWWVRTKRGGAQAEATHSGIEIELPASVLRFVEQFDLGKNAVPGAVRPFEFDFNFQPELPEVAK